MSALAVVRWTMIVATMAWAAGEVLPRRRPRLDRLARTIWTIGVVLALIHVGLAFELIYGWNHEAAVQATVRQTAQRFGSGWRAGIYANYIFLALWLADVFWWWHAPLARAARRRSVERVRVAVFTFMFLNGAVLFASGIGRLIGAVCVSMVLFANLTMRPVGSSSVTPSLWRKY